MPRKHMPKSPRNPSYLLDLFEKQTQALGKISVRDFAEPGEAGTRFDFEASEMLQVAAMRPTLEALSPQARVLSRAMSSRSAKAVEMVFDVHGAEHYLHEPNLPFADIIRAANIPMLRSFARNGFSLANHQERILLQALRRDDPSFYRFFRDELHMTGPILGTTRRADILIAPQPWVCLELAEELTLAFHDPEGIVMSDISVAARGYRKTGTLRHLAILLASGRDLSQDDTLKAAYQSRPDVLELIAHSGTRHGTLKLMQMEPDLHDLLQRRPIAAFFGLSLYASSMTQA